jgi:hypothetical protein
MPYHEFTTRGFLHRRSNAVCGHFDQPLGIPAGSELAKLARELKAAIGPEGFYSWSSEIPDYVVCSERQFAERIREKLREVEIETARAPQQPTQLFLFRLDQDGFSSDSRLAREPAAVTILEGEDGR